MEHVRLLLLILLISIIPSGIVVLISRFEKKRALLKYLPAIILFAAGAGFIVKAREFSQGMEGLGYIILAMIAIGCCILTLITAVVIDILRRQNKKR